MAGCTPRQTLWKVEIPAAQKALLLGLNQVVMQTLAMVVIASLVGASGLGQKLLFSLQQLQLGKAVEQGIAITLIAIVLDRLTQGYMRRRPDTMVVSSPGSDAIGIWCCSLVWPCYAFVLARVPSLGRAAQGHDLVVRCAHQ